MNNNQENSSDNPKLEQEPQEIKQETAEQKETAQPEESHEEKAQKYLDQLLRLQAEFSNYRKRTEKEKADAIRFGREIILERMISLLDVMEQALKHSENATDVTALKTGFQMVVNEFLRFLKSEGAEPLKTTGERFDPHLHEAVEQVETTDENQNNVILEEIQKGYQFHGRLLRPAKVKVAKLKKAV